MIGRATVFSWILWSAPSLGAELRVPAATAYLDPNPEGAQVSAKRGITGWRDPKVHVLWFGDFKSAGKLSDLLPDSWKRAQVGIAAGT